MFQRDKLLYEVDTELEHYQVVDMTYEGRWARVLFSGNRDAAFSGIPMDDNSDLLFDYIQRFYELVCTVRPKRLLMIGGGVYTLPKALIHALPDIQIDVIEIDPGLDPIAEAFFGLQPDERLNIIHQDGKDFLLQTDKVYDMIIIDAFTHLQIPASLASLDTAKLIKRHLTRNGIMAMNIISAYQGRRAQTIRRFHTMYTDCFELTTIFPADKSLSLWQSQNYILLAQKGQAPAFYGMRYGNMAPPI